MAERSRYWLTFGHEGKLSDWMRYSAQIERVSDDEWWNDFPRRHVSLTPRLLPATVQADGDFGSANYSAGVYARTQRWQLLQCFANNRAP